MFATGACGKTKNLNDKRLGTVWAGSLYSVCIRDPMLATTYVHKAPPRVHRGGGGDRESGLAQDLFSCVEH